MYANLANSILTTQSAEYVKYAKIFGDYFWLIFIPTEDLGNPFLLILCLLKILASQWQPILADVVRQPLPGLPHHPHVTPGYSMGLILVRQPEPGLRRVKMLALATRLLGNSQ